jgi:hypothetical protein
MFLCLGLKLHLYLLYLLGCGPFTIGSYRNGNRKRAWRWPALRGTLLWWGTLFGHGEGERRDRRWCEA